MPICARQPELPLTGVAAAGKAEARHPDRQLHRLAASITSALVEVIAGRRPPQQLLGWADPQVQRVATRLGWSGNYSQLRLRSIRIQTPSPEAIEVAAHLTCQRKSHAAALRIVQRDDQWLATQLTIALGAEVIAGQD